MSLESNAARDYPQVDATAYVHPTAVIIGNVRIGPTVHVGPHATIRADEPGPDGRVAPIIIGKEANLQDGVILHALGGTGVTIGPGTSVAHGAVVHGPCEVGRNCFIGFNSVIYNATLGESVVVMHGALVEEVSVPDGLHVPSMTAVRRPDDVFRLRPVSPDILAFAGKVRSTNIQLVEANRQLPFKQSLSNPGEVEGVAMTLNPTVVVVMGSSSDLDVMAEAAGVLEEFGVQHEMRVISAHRTPEKAYEFGRGAKGRGVKVIIAGAGKAAHLAGVMASLTTLPVIGVPMRTSDLGGLDSLLSTVQMPGGIPVATTAIGKAGARNAALLAVAMLALSDEGLEAGLQAYRERMAHEVQKADEQVRGTAHG